MGRKNYHTKRETGNSQDLSGRIALIIAHNFAVAYSKGSYVLTRYNMLLAINLAGAAFTIRGLDAVDGLAYVLRTDYQMAHRRSKAIMSSHVMSFNTTRTLQKYIDIAKAMGKNVEGD